MMPLHVCPKGSFKASPPQFKPYAISDPCPCSKNSLHVCCLYCLGAALALPVCRPHAACALHVRCLCAACALPMRRMHATNVLPYATIRAAYALPCTLPVRCHARCLCAAMRAACALPCMLLCAAMRAFVRCHAHLCFRLWVTCTSLSPCLVFPPRPFARPCPQGLGGVRPWRGHGPPFSLRTCSPLKEHYKPFQNFLRRHQK